MLQTASRRMTVSISDKTENCHLQKLPLAGLWRRCRIKSLMSRGDSIREIARCLGRSAATVSRGGHGYRHKQAQDKAQRLPARGFKRYAQADGCAVAAHPWPAGEGGVQNRSRVA